MSQVLALPRWGVVSTAIKSAIAINKPPLGLLFDDPSRDWTPYDYKLIKAYYLKKQFMTDSGFPIWIDQSERVSFTVKKKKSKSKAAIERANKKKNALRDGEYFIAEPMVMDGGEMPTKSEWLEEMSDLHKGDGVKW